MVAISLPIRDIGEKVRIAGNLKKAPLCVYGSDSIPEGAIPATSVDRCLAKAIFAASLEERARPLYFGRGAMAGCCPGGIGWTGYGRMAPMLSYFISYGTKEFRNGEAEYLKCSPENVEKSREAVGTISPAGAYTVISPCDVLENDPGVRSLICFGNGEQIRNLCGMVHFRSTDTFNAVRGAWGPTCSTLLTYPAGLAEKAPKDSAYIGPMDPTGNRWFPECYMALGIPIKLAIGICEDLDSSFTVKRRHVAYPDTRDI